MKKFRILVLAGLVSLTITGCKSTNEEPIEHNDHCCEYCGADKSEGSITGEGVDSSMKRELDWMNETFDYCPKCVTIELLNYMDYSEMNEQLYMNHISNCSAPHSFYKTEALPVHDDGTTIITEEEFNNMKCENCGNDVSDYVDSCGGYMCDKCGFIK